MAQYRHLRRVNGLLAIKAELGALAALVLEVRFIFVFDAHHILR